MDFRMAGSYKITNLNNDKVYIGESKDVLSRLKNHISKLKSNEHINKELQEDFNVSNKMSDFKVEILQWFDCEGKTEQEIKTTTLYLEAANYILYKLKGFKLYNVIQCNSYNIKALDQYVDTNNIICKNKIIEIMNNDPYGVFNELDDCQKEKAKKMFDTTVNMKDYVVITEREKSESCYNKYCFLTVILDKLSNQDILSKNYDILKIINILCEANLLYWENNLLCFSTVAKENKWCIELSPVNKKDQMKYIITNTGEEKIKEVLSHYSKEYLSLEYYISEEYNFNSFKDKKVETFISKEDRNTLTGVIADILSLNTKEEITQEIIMNVIEKEKIMYKNGSKYYPTDQSIKEKYFIIRNEEFLKYSYYITQKGKEAIIKLFIKQDNKKGSVDKDKNCITNILKELLEVRVLPENYDYHKAMQVLINHKLLYVNENKYYVATDYSLENKYYVLRKNINYKDGTSKPVYYITEKGKKVIINIFTELKNKENLIGEDYKNSNVVAFNW